MKTLFIWLLAALAISSGHSQEDNRVKVLISTDYGDIKAILYNETPQHRDNIVKLVEEGWYDNSPFHRVIENFMIQGGQNADGRRDPGYTIPAEFVDGLFHKRGALAAARLGDQVNPEKESSGCQFYIVQGRVYDNSELDMIEMRQNLQFSKEQREAYTSVGGTPFLDYEYTVFGEVIEGMEVVDNIAAVKTGAGDKPVEDITMTITLLD